jgi:hypothetical protein
MSSTTAVSSEHLGRISVAILAVLVILSCNPYDPLGVKADEQRTKRAYESTTWAIIDSTSDALATRAADVHVAETAFALEVEMHAAQTEEAALAPAPQIDAAAAPAPPGPQAAHVPAILNIDIARQIPADGTKVGGTIIFEDAAQDVVLLRADVLAATLRAESWTYDPRQNMAWSGTRGIAAFQVWCTGDPQDVSYSFTLEDSAGNVSPGWRVDYTCR